MNKTPSKLGFRRTAEWEPHEATWLVWPHNTDDWPGKMSTIQWVYAEIIRHIIPDEPVYIVVDSEKRADKVDHVLNLTNIDPSFIKLIQAPTNRSWIRDFGPLFIKKDGKDQSLGICNFRFNGWSLYDDYELDDEFASLVAQKYNHTFFDPVIDLKFTETRMVLEGGAIEVNGQGTLITTEECLLDQQTQVRNPGMTKDEVESVLEDFFGIINVIWLGQGVVGDDTHGHIDDLCRFVNNTTVLLCEEKNQQDDNYYALQENKERLQDSILENGKKIEIIPLPMPAPLYFSGQRLPASYANFYISNGAVLVPTFNDPMDAKALGIIKECFPKKKVVGIHAVDLIWGLGGIHCITNNQPLINRQ